MKLPRLFLKSGREKAVINRHPWIFSGAIERVEPCDDGSLVRIYSHEKELLGTGYYNSTSNLSARLISFDGRDPSDIIRDTVRDALSLRTALRPANTTGLRLINGEGDGLPGCIVDQYDNVLVLQSGTCGIDALKTVIVEHLIEALNPRVIFEKSDAATRQEEKLSPHVGVLHGALPSEVEFLEYGNRFIADIERGQKTGFFLDQREQRKHIGELAAGRTVLNCFCYSGGFSVYAVRGGAQKVVSIDSSQRALDLSVRNLEFTGRASGCEFKKGDVLEYLNETQERGDFDLVILDPPAFAKKKDQVNQACRGYGEINRAALRLIKPGGLLLTCSCSYHIDKKLFGQVIFQSARDCQRPVRILGSHRQGFDHPVNMYHPEGDYLKSLLLWVG